MRVRSWTCRDGERTEKQRGGWPHRQNPRTDLFVLNLQPPTKRGNWRECVCNFKFHVFRIMASASLHDQHCCRSLICGNTDDKRSCYSLMRSDCCWLPPDDLESETIGPCRCTHYMHAHLDMVYDHSEKPPNHTQPCPPCLI